MANIISCPDGFFTQEQFKEALNLTSIALIEDRYFKPAFKHGLLKENAIHIEKRGGREFKFYPKSWVATLQKDWGIDKEAGKFNKDSNPDGWVLPRRRAPRGSKVTKSAKPSKTAHKTAYKPASHERTINVTVPSQDAYDLLLEQLGSKANIAKFLLEKLQEKYEPNLSKIEKAEREFEAKIRLIEEEREQIMKALKAGKPVKASILGTDQEESKET